MIDFNRRKFLKATTVLMVAPFIPASFEIRKHKPLLSFSTLGCPDWSFKKITEFAVQHNYTGIELRGLLREMDLTKCPEFSTPQNIAATLSLMKDKNLAFVDLGSSTKLNIANSIERKKNLDEAKRFIELAQKIHCPFVRVFPNELPKDQDKNATMDLIIKGLQELGDYAKGSNVSVLMETHGDLVWTKDIETIMQSAFNAHTGLVWDVTNMWSITKEPPIAVYQKLKKYIRHTHIKDLEMIDGKEHYTLPGEGEVPIFTAVDAMRNGGYKGYYSFEWEKLWHPEIAEPEIVLADYSKVMLQHFNK
ncbi:MAG: sugar phosphate isomerase/epimerase family protein [Bacteroidota bacterium]|nr:sugar phosphate isomerase/epimerase family protein [Bacteroidota bacterium]